MHAIPRSGDDNSMNNKRQYDGGFERETEIRRDRSLQTEKEAQTKTEADI